MPTLRQLIPAAGPFDAVSNEAVAIREALLKLGYGSELFAEHVAPELKRQAIRLSKFPSTDSEPVLLHHCLWSEVVDVALAARGPLLVRYHNVTPPEWYDGVNDVLADRCRRGRAVLPTLASRATIGIAASEFNRRELAEAGVPRTAVVPILLPERAPPDQVTRRSEPLVITIGRIAPNKRIDEVLRVFALFQRACRREASLVIVGSGGASDAYERACRRLATRLGVRNVVFAGRVTDSEKDRFLAEASAYISMSEHEGFSIPIVEAMRRGVPVLARAAGAVPETLGEGGIAVEATDHAELAELLDLLVSDAGVRAAVLAAQRREVERFEPARVRKQLVEVLGGAIDPEIVSTGNADDVGAGASADPHDGSAPSSFASRLARRLSTSGRT